MNLKAVLPAYFGVSGNLDMEQKTMCSILYSAEPNVVEHGNTKDTLAVLHFGTVLAPVAFLQLSNLSKSSTQSLPKITGSVITAKTIFDGKRVAQVTSLPTTLDLGLHPGRRFGRPRFGISATPQTLNRHSPT